MIAWAWSSLSSVSICRETPRIRGYFANDFLLARDEHCPQYLEAFGKANGTRDENIESFFILEFWDRLEQVDVDIRLSLPSYNLDLSKIPIIVPNSSKVLEDNWLKTKDPLDSVLPSIASILRDYSLGGHEEKDSKQIPITIRAAINGINGTNNPEVLLDPAKYIEKKKRVAGIVTAQILNNNARVSLNESEKHTIGPATVFQPRKYVIQSRISTYILEGVLAAMIICGGAAITLMNTRNVIPKNPTTIAAVASLLAGSEMLKESVIPRGSEWCDDKEPRRRRIFESVTFSMK